MGHHSSPRPEHPPIEPAPTRLDDLELLEQLAAVPRAGLPPERAGRQERRSVVDLWPAAMKRCQPRLPSLADELAFPDAEDRLDNGDVRQTLKDAQRQLRAISDHGVAEEIIPWLFAA